MQLRGRELPAPGAWVSVVLVAHDFTSGARVVWKDDHRGAIGLVLAHAPPALCGAGPGALLLVDDDALAAELCEPMRRHGLCPHAVATELEAILVLEHEPIVLAVLAGQPFGMPLDELLGVLADEYPNVARIPEIEELEGVLASYAPN
jgi:hypothetical protein